jgi:hypothetical protein
VKLIFDLPQVDTGSKIPEGPLLDSFSSDAPLVIESLEPEIDSQEDQDSASEVSSLDFLRPLGAGRGLNPFQSFPLTLDERMRQLINFGIITIGPVDRVSANTSSTSTRQKDLQTICRNMVHNQCLGQECVSSYYGKRSLVFWCRNRGPRRGNS